MMATSLAIGRLGRPHGVAGEMYVDGCPLTPEQFLGLGPLEWRGKRGTTRTLRPLQARAALDRMLVSFAGIATREAAAELVNGTVWADSARLPDPGPGVSYAFQLVGMRVVDPAGHELGRVADVVWIVGQPLLQLEGPEERLLPCQPPFMKHVDTAAGVITLDLPPGFDEV
jgi:16S rRNA processing protein RimM